MLDTNAVRAHFEGLGDDWALFDNAGGSLPAKQVVDRVRHYLETLCVQLGATYPRSAASTEAVDEGRRAVATLMNAKDDEVVINGSTTLNVYILAQALRATWQDGDEIVVTNLDHEANVGAWRRLEETGIVVREWKFDRASMSLRVEDLEPLLGPRTKLVCFTHCSNVVGTIHDVPTITKTVHDAGALVCVDGVAYAPHRPIDVAAWDVDFYLCSLYKVYGPHLAALYGKRGHLLAARSQNHFFIGNDEVPYKLQPGNVNHELSAALPGILEYFDAIADAHGVSGGTARERLDGLGPLIAEHEASLAKPLLEFLDGHPKVRIVGERTADPAKRVPTIAFTVDGHHAEDIATALEADRVAARWGHFYAARAIEVLGLEDAGGIVRVSAVHYNTADEVQRAIEAIDRALTTTTPRLQR